MNEEGLKAVLFAVKAGWTKNCISWMSRDALKKQKSSYCV